MTKAYVQIRGAKEIADKLGSLDPKIVASAGKVLKEEAQKVARQAETEAPDKFPSNLNRSKGGRRSKTTYTVKSAGPLQFRIKAGGGIGGMAAQRAEYMTKSESPQGAVLVREFMSRIGSGEPGRYAWVMVEKDRPQLEAAVKAATETVTREIERLGI